MGMTREQVDRVMEHRRNNPYHHLTDSEKLNLALNEINILKKRVYELEIKLSGEPMRVGEHVEYY